MQSFYNNPYSYFSTKILPFFFLALYHYPALHAIPAIKSMQYEVNILYGNNNYTFLKNLSLVLFTFLRFPHTVKRNVGIPIYQWRYLFITRGNYLFELYLKFITTTLAKLRKNAYENSIQPNNQYMFTLSKYNTIETHFFELNLYDQIFSGFIAFRFQLKRSPLNLGIEQQNLLRMLNVPLTRKLSY